MGGPAGESLSARTLNRTMLLRQGLLRRSPCADTTDVANLLRRMGFLQAQYAPSMYIGCAARLSGFERHHLTRGLADRSLVQGTLLRGTIHLLAADDYWPAALAHP